MYKILNEVDKLFHGEVSFAQHHVKRCPWQNHVISNVVDMGSIIITLPGVTDVYGSAGDSEKQFFLKMNVLPLLTDDKTLNH